MKKIVLFISIAIMVGCKKDTYKLKFLDEFVVKDSLAFNGSIVGGLSGIDVYKDTYYLVVDDAKAPRVITSKIEIKDHKIAAIQFLKVIPIADTLCSFYKEEILDLESVFVDAQGNLNLTSEGSIKKGKRPTVFITDTLGSFKEEVSLPNYFSNINVGKPKHNGVFEGSCKGIENQGFWVAVEAPLEVDGEEPTFTETSSPIRITYFDNRTKKATKQYAYQLEKLSKPAKGSLNLNGVTAILEYQPNQLLVVERIYQSGYGSYGNTIRIFSATATAETTNTVNMEALKETSFVPMKKELLFDFANIQDQLTDGIIDNIEGITFGPTLPNGNRTLILVADDNFQVHGKQLNQFILLEMLQ